MNTVHNRRSQLYYSQKEAELYEKDAPEGEQYRVYQDTIRTKCIESKQGIAILELGCGTGRYFFYLANVNKLTGVDYSENMLEAARENVKRIPELASVTDFVHSRIEDFHTEEKFDLIYSIGTLGEYCEFNVKVLEKIVSFLKPNGLFFFTIVDSESYVNDEYVGPGKKIFRFAVKFLPQKFRVKFEAKSLIADDWKDIFLSRNQVEEILSSSKIPIKWELSKSKDNKHIHHIGKVWLADAMFDLCPFIDYLFVL